MINFKEIMRDHQVIWRNKYLPEIKGNGWQNGKSYDHILPKKHKTHNFYPSIQESIFEYLDKNNIQPHTGIHNLLSSWVVCANFYWPFNNEKGKKLLAKYLNDYSTLDIKNIHAMELEYLDDDIVLSPSVLLGEDEGIRGSGQTSPDLAIKFETSTGAKSILLIESKFTEHSFYQCSGYAKVKPGKPINPDKKRCFDTIGIIESDLKNCHLLAWDRKYWIFLKNKLNVDVFQNLKKCPMSTSCYQLFRQHALAEGYKQKYDNAISCVFADDRNEKLTNCACSTGLKPFPAGWKSLFPKVEFIWLSHNNWFNFVKENNENGNWSTWLDYIKNRYMKLNVL